jgi:hypothetical protein
MPYEIIDHGPNRPKGIRCLRRINGKVCRAESYHPRHVERKHCIVCNYFHPEVSGEVVPPWKTMEPAKLNPNLGFVYFD